MKKLYLFILSICLIFTSCTKTPTEAFQMKPVYEVTGVEGASLIEDGTGALIGLVTGGFGGLLIGAVAEDTVNKLDIKNNNVKVTLVCTKPENMRGNYTTVVMDVKESDLLIKGIKIGDKLEYVKNMTFVKAIDGYGNSYIKVPFSETMSYQLGFFKKLEEEVND